MMAWLETRRNKRGYTWLVIRRWILINGWYVRQTRYIRMADRSRTKFALEHLYFRRRR